MTSLTNFFQILPTPRNSKSIGYGAQRDRLSTQSRESPDIDYPHITSCGGDSMQNAEDVYKSVLSSQDEVLEKRVGRVWLLKRFL
jgi:hypothetical protein